MAKEAAVPIVLRQERNVRVGSTPDVRHDLHPSLLCIGNRTLIQVVGLVRFYLYTFAVEHDVKVEIGR